MAFIPNKIQMNPGLPPFDNTLKFGDVYVGVDTYKPYGPTSITNWYNGYAVPTGGYVTYLNKGSIDPSIYMCNNNFDLIENGKQVFAANISTVEEALDLYYQSSTELCVNFDYDDLDCEGLLMAFDFGYTPCFPRQGTSFKTFGKFAGVGQMVNGFQFATSGSNNQKGEVYLQNATQNQVISLTMTPMSLLTLSIWYRPNTANVSSYTLFECNGTVSNISLDDSGPGAGFGFSAAISQDGGTFNALNNAGQYMFNDNAVHNIIVTFGGTGNVTLIHFLNDLTATKGMNGSILAAFAWDKTFTDNDAIRHYNALQFRLS